MKIIFLMFIKKLKKIALKVWFRFLIILYKMLIVFFKERRKYLMEMIQYFELKIEVLEEKAKRKG